MTNDSQGLKQLIQDLIARSTTEQVHATQRYGEFLQRAVRGELDEQAVHEEYLRFAREETRRYLHDLIALGLKVNNELLELSSTYNDHFFERVLSATTSGRMASAPHAAPPERIEMELRGPVGQDV